MASLWNIFRRKDARANHAFDERDRELALQRRQMNAELENLKRAHALAEEKLRHETKMLELQLENEQQRLELEELLSENDLGQEVAEKAGMSEEGMMVMKLLEKIGTKPPASPPPVTSSPVTASTAPAASPISDEQIRELWRNTEPRIKSLAPACSDAQVCEYIHHVMPHADNATVARALAIIRAA